MQTSRGSLEAAVTALAVTPDIALVDGNVPPLLGCAVRTVVGGDGLSFSIAAASVAAKVTRDRLMRALAPRYPGYGWETNVGYATREHGADAVVERIARGEHTDPPATMAQNLRRCAVERARPRPRSAADKRRGETKLPPPAKYDLRSLDQTARHRAQTVDAIFANADDGQPVRRCGSVARNGLRILHATRPHSRRHHGRPSAR